MSPRRRQSNPANPFASRRASDAVLGDFWAGGFPYSRKLSAHTSCVNALSFSAGDARYLASGGDDLCIYIWDFHQDDIKAPLTSFVGPMGNVFALAFSATNRHLYCGGADSTILKFDVSQQSRNTQPNSPSETFRHHKASIRGISCHPRKDEEFLSASDDGSIMLHDCRVNSTMTRAQGTLQIQNEFTGVQWHPMMDHIFVTSDARGRVCLRDTRMTFGPLSRRTKEGIVQKYNTKISKKSIPHLRNTESSSVTFDHEGTKLAVTIHNYLPTIYSLSDSHPIATCSGKNHPDGTQVAVDERTYSNACTIKHGSFGLDGKYYSAGSDDFRGYVWKIPSVPELVDRRQELNMDDWMPQDNPNTIAFAEGLMGPRYLPIELSTPSCRLMGHDSIVNTTLIHPHFPHILTSGIERHIILHSPTPTSSCTQGLPMTSTDVRALSNPDDPRQYLRTSHALENGGLEDSETEEELHTIAYFDQILREEGSPDLFSEHQWFMSSDEESDASSSGDSDM